MGKMNQGETYCPLWSNVTILIDTLRGRFGATGFGGDGTRCHGNAFFVVA
jgi:hypothetical protein